MLYDTFFYDTIKTLVDLLLFLYVNATDDTDMTFMLYDTVIVFYDPHAI